MLSSAVGRQLGGGENEPSRWDAHSSNPVSCPEVSLRFSALETPVAETGGVSNFGFRPGLETNQVSRRLGQQTHPARDRGWETGTKFEL